MPQFNPDDLIGTKYRQPSSLAAMREAEESWAYYNRAGVYPRYNFGPTVWTRNEPLPAAPPYTRIIVDKFASFVFRGGAPIFSVPDNEPAEDLLASIIKDNDLDSKWIERGRMLGCNGTLAIKFSYDPDDEDCPVTISFLDCPQQCDVWLYPNDSTRIAMARIQYPYQDFTTGEWKVFREEWTKNRYVQYKPVTVRNGRESVIQGFSYSTSFGDDSDWEVDSNDLNPFGVIPITVIKNVPMDGLSTGRSDCAGTFRDQDELAATYASMRRYNTISAWAPTVITDADVMNVGALIPGEILSLQSNDSENKAGITQLELQGTSRQWTADYVDRYESSVRASVGLSSVNTEAITNSGAVSALAVSLLYEDTVATCNLKRQQLSLALTKFFSNMLLGLRNIKAFDEVSSYNPKLQEVSVTWGDYFDTTDQDKQLITNRTVTQLSSGIIDKQRATERIAKVEGIPANEIGDVVDDTKNITPVGSDTNVANNSGAVASEFIDSSSPIIS